MQKVKTCPVCGGQFVANKNTTVYCSKVCYGADSNRKKMRRANIDVGYRELVAPPRDEFDLEVGDLITGPDKQLDGDKNKRHEFRVTKYTRISSRLSERIGDGNAVSRRPTT